MPKTLTLLAAAAAALALWPACALAQERIVIGPAPEFPELKRPPKPPPTPVVVSLGDSAISGEAGRWAGNTKWITDPVDALGPHAYDDNASGTGEVTPGCHRSKSAEVQITADELGHTVDSVNLACSGALTVSRIDSRGNSKPGVDFTTLPTGVKGQALQLREYATAHPHAVKAVVVLVGANNYGFGTIAGTCVLKWVQSYWNVFDHDVCQDEPNLVSMFTPGNIAAKTAEIKAALQNAHMAMSSAGYADSEYRIIAQTYSSAIPPGSGFRYGDRDVNRQAFGGCGIWNDDANWMQSVVRTFNDSIKNAAAQSGIPNIDVLDATDAFAGRRLCENGVGLIENMGLANWLSPGAVDRLEWIKQINDYLPSNASFFEGAHPNYWGQMALRSCLRQAYNNGAPHGGTCVRSGALGLNSRGEPQMLLR